MVSFQGQDFVLAHESVQTLIKYLLSPKTWPPHARLSATCHRKSSQTCHPNANQESLLYVQTPGVHVFTYRKQPSVTFTLSM